MTFIGKLFVMLNLILSMLMGALAFGLYVGGIDWSDAKGKPGQPPGKLVPLRDEVTSLTKDLFTAENSYRLAATFKRERADEKMSDGLYALEERREDFRRWYDGELRKLTAEKGAVSEVAFDKGLPKLDAALRPTMVAAKEGEADLQTYIYYVNEVERLRKENGDLQKQVKMRVEEDGRLTKVIIGDAPIRGLTAKITAEQARNQGILAELGIVKGLEVNVEVESELVYKRLQTLDERIQEMVRYLKRKHNLEVSGKWR